MSSGALLKVFQKVLSEIWEPKGSQREPKGIQNGIQRDPKGSQREPNRGPKGSQSDDDNEIFGKGPEASRRDAYIYIYIYICLGDSWGSTL